ncbi:hypothetical protein NQ317_009081 [Molorchus minor]|uniref:Uncharacterized protein n=1 Tax=Molorchus minor TaxID=1323400 RepID=A0ABQ9JF57_9CUCU|nr:hypothetical protein NQ317_009081 [Molorchus minor]
MALQKKDIIKVQVNSLVNTPPRTLDTATAKKKIPGANLYGRAVLTKLTQADMAAFQATGRSDPENKPSQVAKTIEQLLSELSRAFRESIFSLFSSRESEDDDEVVDGDDKTDGSGRDSTGVCRMTKSPLKIPECLEDLKLCEDLAFE